MHVRMYVGMNECVCMYESMYVCMYVCMYICMCIHIYVYTTEHYTHKRIFSMHTYIQTYMRTVVHSTTCIYISRESKYVINKTKEYAPSICVYTQAYTYMSGCLYCSTPQMSTVGSPAIGTRTTRRTRLLRR